MSKSNADEPPFISVPAAAEILGCSDVWVIRLIEKGTLEGFRLSGRAWAVNRESVTKNVQEYLKRDPTVAGRRRSKMG
jgi:excisionase family DNA binding protein